MKKYNAWAMIWVLTIGCASFNACTETDHEAVALEKETTADFLKQASAVDMFEITAGMMAEDQGSKRETKNIGQQLVHVHSRTSEALGTIAKRKSVPLPDEMPVDKKRLINQLEEKAGKEFDKDFAEVQITAHQETIALYEKAEQEITDQEVKAYIDQILPVLKEHLAELQKVQTNLITMK